MRLKRRLPKASRLSDTIRVRVTEAQKRAIAAAAARAGVEVSEWVRELVVTAATP